MKSFQCPQCASPVFFENVRCLVCGSALGFLPTTLEMGAYSTGNSSAASAPTGDDRHEVHRPCRNGVEHGACNWMVRAEENHPFCLACRMNATIPDLTVDGNRERWHKFELAKRRLIYSALRLSLPLESSASGGPPIRFEFLAEIPGGPPIRIGHRSGMITLNIAEADDDYRERHRASLREPFRTLLGHFRHESGHYYWDRLIASGPRLDAFRSMFGDERIDYVAALQQYYQSGPPDDWSARGVSAYATAHPWEDWAETWAHYLHMVDSVETARTLDIDPSWRRSPATPQTSTPSPIQSPSPSLSPTPPPSCSTSPTPSTVPSPISAPPPVPDPTPAPVPPPTPASAPGADPGLAGEGAASGLTPDHSESPDFASLLHSWLPLTCALNSLNRGMGLPDLYPFALSDAAIRKLNFVHDIIAEAR